MTMCRLLGLEFNEREREREKMTRGGVQGRRGLQSLEALFTGILVSGIRRGKDQPCTTAVLLTSLSLSLPLILSWRTVTDNAILACNVICFSLNMRERERERERESRAEQSDKSETQ